MKAQKYTQTDKEKKVILQFLRDNILATISTVNNKTLQPESALIAYAELPTLEVIFIALEGSRKFMNLKENKHVSLVVGWDPRPSHWNTLQYEGDAYPISEEERPKYKQIFSKKKDTPCTEEFLSKPGMKFFKITPTWIGYSGFTGKKPYVIELKDF